MEDELLFERRSTSVKHFVHIDTLHDHGWEPLFSELAGVESVPAGVHEGIESVVEARASIANCTFIGHDVDWLGGTVQSVSVKTIEDHGTELVSAEIGIPSILLLADVLGIEDVCGV